LDKFVNKLAPAEKRYQPHRNKFQVANDRKLAIELLSAGKTYAYIAKHIATIREYSLSAEQVRLDVGQIQEELIAAALSHGLEAIATELDRVENLMVDISRRIKTFPDGDPKVAPLLKQMADLAARETYLKGGDTWIKAQDLNQAIERVTRAGFKVVDPIGAGSREEAIEVGVSEVAIDA
jgi:hypothetical protein